MSATTSRHIYLADDDADDRLLFEDALVEIDCHAQLTFAENGKKLMELLNPPPKPLPDILFLDLNMPLKNGYECLAEIRQDNSRLKNLRIVVLTTSQDERNVEKVFGLGASFYAVKPTDFMKLKQLLEKILAIQWCEKGLQPNKKQFMLSA
ncbi:response regulator [Flavobacterium sp.]|uniref:response regulator n=1 Tax=Flavobacterium sp. TaxID=239 RepID=UPI002620B157|nr:response regulator [Flavobacterium sp.]